MVSDWAYLWVFEIAAVSIACMEGILHLAHAARTEVSVSASGCEGGACPIQFDDSLQESPCGRANMSAPQPMQHRWELCSLHSRQSMQCDSGCAHTTPGRACDEI